MLEQFRISDFLEWNESKGLKLNPDFQRGSVWSPAARIMLIDTILRDLPVPKIFIRSLVDRITKRTVREVVDGQQRLRAIIDFAADRITLSSRAKEFAGLKFSTLSVELQDRFLEYPLAVDQLINASDERVLDIFARLNSYNIKLSAPELRHAAYQGEFRTSVHENSVSYLEFWSKSGVFSYRDMVRMESDALVAEMYITLLEGVSDGGSVQIDRMYKKYDPVGRFNREEVEQRFSITLGYISKILAPRLADRNVLKPPHLLMLFAAVAHAQYGIPQGRLEDSFARKFLRLDANLTAQRLSELSILISSKEEPENEKEFWRASRSSTQRIASRRPRFATYFRAVTG